ncbi:hypothetical protein [Legionella israelensis]|uniref:Uncharacterized protein n=1 Tax=Legionella israelensis TaxID=454 RepID=A0A0W0VGY8_9GAMM|nr:hypothetical protein [Legionella israelensis]KTD19408.1 hypothetical protein Lisr_1970 [Legionella israelensis]QBS08621.1 hypothetical protein E4T55_01355 [Legionella israelensis]SCY09508.1 hypothetical protein SAMN02746069_01262 [Legionella israelensis DSM 19235]STX58283.1 Uncharacterised protein [Legionella israelensis]
MGDYSKFLADKETELQDRIKQNINSQLKAITSNSFLNNFLFFLKDPSKEFLKKILNSPSLTPMEKFGAVAEHYSNLKSQDPWKRKIAMIFQKLGDGIPTDVALRIENAAITAYKKKWAAQYEYKCNPPLK